MGYPFKKIAMQQGNFTFFISLAVLLLLPADPALRAKDWPMWRYDAARRGYSEERLPEALHLQWVLELPSPRTAWPSTQNEILFDRLYEPVLLGKTIFLASMISDKVAAHNTEDGRELWTFYTEGPVRFAPAAWNDKVYFTSDDGYLYAVNAADGSLAWKFRGGTSDRKVLGNHRLISAWPARGAPVVYDGTVYFGASIWPFMGIFIHALDAETGAIIWSSSGTGSSYMNQQHDSAAFAGVSPQGYLAATEKYLVIAGGRTVPAVFDRKNGEMKHFNVASRAMGDKGGGGYEVVCGENFYLNRGKLYRMDNGRFFASADALVVSDHAVIGKDKEGIIAFRPRCEEVETKDNKGKVTKKTVIKKTWSTPLERKIDQVFLRSGTRLYCSGDKGEILAVDLPFLDRGVRVSWSTKLPDHPLNMIVGDGKLIVTTDQGRIYCFGKEDRGLPMPVSKKTDPVTLISKGAAWKYLDAGGDQGARWRAADFDDGKWASGKAPLGYGEGGEATELSFGPDKNKKPITCYFRRGPEIPREGRYSELRLNVLVDDGAVIYLNGKEVGRISMPGGEVRHDTKASEAVEAKEFQEIRTSGEHLRAGKNVLAVEVHQASRTSSDLRFDLELIGTPEGQKSKFRLRDPEDQWSRLARDILQTAASAREEKMAEGYCLALGLGSGRLVERLASQSKLHVIAVDPDRRKVDAFRRRVDRMGAYGTRIAALAGDPLEMELPAYLAELVVAEDPEAAGFGRDERFIQRIFHILRPYSGVACFVSQDGEHRSFARAAGALQLDKGRVERSGNFTLLRRTDAPTGSGEWTHQYGDAANTVSSRDTLVKLPLGLLWFGGPSHEGVLPRHGHGPTPQVVGGRLFIEGRNMIRAVDIYTGRLLWESNLKDVGQYYDNLSHEPGANILGSNYVSLRDGIYVIHGKKCLRLHPATGKTISEFQLPEREGEKDPPDLGYICVWENDLVIGSQLTGFSPPDFTLRDFAGLKDDPLKNAVQAIHALKDFEPIPREKDEKPDDKNEKARNDRKFLFENLNKLLMDSDMIARIPLKVRHKADAEGEEKKLKEYLEKVPGRKPTDHEALVIKRDLLHRYYKTAKYESKPAGKFGSFLRSGSKKLHVLDRHTGQIQWEHEALYEFRHNGIAMGKGFLFAIDRMSDREADLNRRRGQPANEKARVVAIDLQGGKVAWSSSRRVFGTWLGYSENHDVLLQAGSSSRDRAHDEVGKGLVAYRGSTGKVLWENDESYSGPCVIIDHTLITQVDGSPGFALDLLTGELKMVPHPLSGELIKWQYNRNYGCNTAVGSPFLLTFRSAAAGYCDLAGESGTGNFGGFRSGCTSNLIPAGGILNAPDYTRTCTCSYQNQASLAMIHMPENEMWTFSPYKYDGKPVRNLGLNFGAPGDRRGADGTLWLDYPVVGGNSPHSSVHVFSDDVDYIRLHESRIQGGDLPWVASSGLTGSGEIAIKLISPSEFEVANEVQGRSPLKASNATISAAVSSRTIPRNGERNFTSLKKGRLMNDLEATIGGYKELAAPSLTVEFWIQADCEFDYVDARGKDKSEQGFVIDNRQLRLRYFVSNKKGDQNEKVVTIASKDKIPDNKWIHVAFTYDAASGVGTLFRDGKAVGTHDGPDNRPLWWNHSTPDLVVGKEASFRSYLDELRICRGALKPEQFLCSSTAGGDNGNGGMHREDVVGYWRMESNKLKRRDANLALECTYTVRLVFAEIEDLQPGERIFDVALQGRTHLQDFDIAEAAGGSNRIVIREIPDLFIPDYLRITLISKSERRPLLCGVQVIGKSRGF